MARTNQAQPGRECEGCQTGPRTQAGSQSQRGPALQALQRHGQPALAEEIGRHIGVPVGEAKLQRFADGEVYFQLLENVRGVDVFVVQPTCYPVDQNLMELLVMIDALKRASAARITVVVPYYGYARQDRKDRPRVAISAKLIADLLTTAGANRALFVDLHAAQIQGFFNIPVDHCSPARCSSATSASSKLPNLIVVSPDAGGVERARFFAQKMGAPLAIVDKRRTDINVAEVMNVVGDVHGKTCLIIDDIIDTAGTLVKTVDALYANGAASRVRLRQPRRASPARPSNALPASRLEQVVVTNTIPLREAAQKLPKIKVLSIAGLLGAAIESIHMETSVSTLFS